MNAVLFDIQRNAYADGPGIRTTVFFKGCNLKCAWCHNPESQADAPQMMQYEDLCIGCGKCKEVCPNESCTFAEMRSLLPDGRPKDLRKGLYRRRSPERSSQG